MPANFFYAIIELLKIINKEIIKKLTCAKIAQGTAERVGILAPFLRYFK